MNPTVGAHEGRPYSVYASRFTVEQHHQLHRLLVPDTIILDAIAANELGDQLVGGRLGQGKRQPTRVQILELTDSRADVVGRAQYQAFALAPVTDVGLAAA